MPLLLKTISGFLANKIIEQHHYLHKGPNSNTLSFGIYSDNKLEGTIIFSVPVGMNTNKYVRDTKPSEILELSRLWLSDNLEKNSESKVISIALKLVKKLKPNVKWIISYADSEAGHMGTIYQATNWYYIGKSQNIEYIYNGQKIHKRSLGQLVVTSKNRHKIFGKELITRKMGIKYTYIYFLDKSREPFLQKPIMEYPKVNTRI